MKKFILILFSFMLCSCSAQKKQSEIVYFLPSSVKEILSKEIQKRKMEGKNLYLVLDKGNENTYVLYLNNISGSSEKFWIEHSNRSVFLNGQLIPFYFYMDEFFSYPENGGNVLRKLGTEEGVRKVIINRENAFQISFNSSGEIIK
ncbi:hypothetical protein MUU74_15970 [Chryseobacterium daecheongense]|uniref:hypothetical protein n=1 Tax=Chryseobacterium daecheongense TaxID=192389 RepID=UPI001FD6E66B|nr:hypothetical protein [Chryseobacterium daecheongense]UOU97978.1 hypothetical protein MUU74_15970 [Chryseobacterium daecheongense]